MGSPDLLGEGLWRAAVFLSLYMKSWSFDVSETMNKSLTSFLEYGQLLFRIFLQLLHTHQLCCWFLSHIPISCLTLLPIYCIVGFIDEGVKLAIWRIKKKMPKKNTAKF